MIAVVNVVNSVGHGNTVSFELGHHSNRYEVMAQLEKNTPGLQIVVATIVTNINGKLETYAMRRTSEGDIRFFNQTPLKCKE